MNKKIVVPVGWSTTDTAPQFLQLEFSPEVIAKIKKVMQLVKSEGLESAKIRFDEVGCFVDKECTEESEFLPALECLIIHDYSIAYSAQHKHDDSAQIESDPINIEQIEG